MYKRNVHGYVSDVNKNPSYLRLSERNVENACAIYYFSLMTRLRWQRISCVFDMSCLGNVIHFSFEYEPKNWKPWTDFVVLFNLYTDLLTLLVHNINSNYKKSEFHEKKNIFKKYSESSWKKYKKWRATFSSVSIFFRNLIFPPLWCHLVHPRI